MAKEKQEKINIWRNQILQNSQDITPLKLKSSGKPLILKYRDIELHFDGKNHHGLYLIYSDEEIDLSITPDDKEGGTQNESI